MKLNNIQSRVIFLFIFFLLSVQHLFAVEEKKKNSAVNEDKLIQIISKIKTFLSKDYIVKSSKSDSTNLYILNLTEFKGKMYGIIPVALEQARIAASNILEMEHDVYTGTIPSNTLKVVDIDLISVGIVNPEEPKYEEIKKEDKKNGVYKKLVLDKGKIVGAILLGDRKGVSSIRKLIAQKTDITKYSDSILQDDFDYKKVASLTKHLRSNES